ncbi:MAG: SIMPL domain-containing protein [Anaerolineales bacterium]|nr:SIMPL domain-containing protein [Anaerolineales bacterium]
MIRPTRTMVGLALAALGLLTAAACAAAPAAAQTGVPADTPRTISVTGTGTAYGAPDVATVQVGVQTRSENAGQAVNDNSTRVAALIAALKALGIAEKDMQTTNFSVYVQQNYDPQTGRPLETIYYQVDNTLNVTVRDTSRLGDVLTGAVDAGANSIYGVSFSVADPAALQGQARELAVANARERAEQLAAAAGVTLDVPLSISEVSYVAQPVYAARDMAMAEGAPVPVQTGQIQVDLQVNITYTIK